MAEPLYSRWHGRAIYLTEEQKLLLATGKLTPQEAGDIAYHEQVRQMDARAKVKRGEDYSIA